MPVMTRRVAAISVLLASGGLLAGCGSAGDTASKSARSANAKSARSSGASGAGHVHAGEPLSQGRAKAKAQAQVQAKAQAFVRAVNLRAADLSGFRVSSEHGHAADQKRMEQELLRCVGPDRATAGLAEAGSGDYERHGAVSLESVSSEVTVARTPALAAKELTAYRSGRLPKCLSHYFSRLLNSESYHGARVSPVSTRKGSPPAPGTTGSFGLRFTATVTLHGVPIPLYVDILGFVDRTAEVSLLTTGIPAPFPAAAEEQLFTLLLERAKTHSI
jgi:hypothetical protein